jgi:hypothetical protein
MTNKERAKIFAPFDALKGFKEALKEEEETRIPKIMLSEDQELVLDNTIKILENGMMIEVMHYNVEKECYLKTIGILAKIDGINKCIFVVKNKILIENIIDIKIVSDTLDF